MNLKKKGQGAVEFMIILVFVLTIILGIMYILSVVTIDLKSNQNDQEVDDFAKSIVNEFNLISKVEGGYSRNITIQANLVKKFQPQINSTYLILTNTENFDSKYNKTYYYELPINSTYTITNDSNGNYYISISKPTSNKFEGITLIN